MPTEIRHILFRPSEIVTAVTDYSRRTGAKLPTGSIVRCAVESEVQDGVEAVRFSMEIAMDGAAQQRREIVTGGASLAAALILFCRDHHIPLPISSDKSLRCFGEQLALVVTRNPRNRQMPQV